MTVNIIPSLFSHELYSTPSSTDLAFSFYVASLKLIIVSHMQRHCYDHAKQCKLCLLIAELTFPPTQPEFN